MTQAKLKDALRSMIKKYGLEQVYEHLHEIQAAEPYLKQPLHQPTPSNGSHDKQKVTRKPKPTAPQYVAKMGLPYEKEQPVAHLAGRFQEKSFLPTFGDIANFCQIYGIDVPASNSRASAIPRVFKFIASMETDDIRRILDEGMFSGPSRLGPIADAIRRNGRASTAYRANLTPLDDNDQRALRD